MSYACFEVTIDDQIAHIVLSRPQKRNAMNADFWRELPEIVRDIDDNSKARIIVLSAQGPVFSSGIDLSMFAKIGGDGNKNAPDYGARLYDDIRALQDSFTALEQCRIPVIACVQGAALGGAVDLITACDMRYGTADSYVSIYEINVGMTADVGTFPRILNHLPEGLVRELAYTGRRMEAEECERRGLYNAIYESHEEMMSAVLDIARNIASKPPMAVYGCKRVITYSRDHSTADTLDNIALWNMSMLLPAEMQEAITAKAQKRLGKYAELPKRAK